mmetsp:Transcript_10293/g.22648  ORF Transcript_10293/g.22648 Transcript_10293/m.22648 type:complete len:134 (+) Transcript_10293:1403-1804(+)
MVHAAKEYAAGTTGSTAADSMIRLLYLEIVRKDDYKKWKKDPQLCPQPRVSTNTIDDSTPELIQERFDISHLSEHLTAWEKQLPTTYYRSAILLFLRRERHDGKFTNAHFPVRNGRPHLELRVFRRDMGLKNR